MHRRRNQAQSSFGLAVFATVLSKHIIQKLIIFCNQYPVFYMPLTQSNLRLNFLDPTQRLSTTTVYRMRLARFGLAVYTAVLSKQD